MDYAVNSEYEPTITLIKSKLADLNNEINELSNEKYKFQEWNILSMKKPIFLKKYNSQVYSGGDKPLQQAVSGGWWGNSSPGTSNNWGFNIFPNSNAWWVGNLPDKVNSNNLVAWKTYGFSYFYYVYNNVNPMNVYIYYVGQNNLNNIKINGKLLTLSEKKSSTYARSGGGGWEATTSLPGGKNVFEITQPTGLPNSGFVFYISSLDKSNVLFKSGDPAWGVTTTPVPDYTLITNSSEATQDTKSAKIVGEINEINDLIASTLPSMNDNIEKKDSNKEMLLNQVNQLKITYNKLMEDLKKPISLDGTYQVSVIQAHSNFSKYILYLLFAIFIVGSLIYIFKNPEVGNLDMFIMVLAVFIFIYYTYEFIKYSRRS
jgi:hypothetical protein